MGARKHMTYYLVRHYKDGREETIPYTASGTRQAIERADALMSRADIAEYAHIKDCTGRVICTLLPLDRLNEIKPKKTVQLELF